MNRKKKSLQSIHLGEYKEKVHRRLEYWEKKSYLQNLWAKNHSLWSSRPVSEIENRLGWLNLPEKMPGCVEDFLSFAHEVKSEGITHVVLLGMGGSSLAPEVFQKTFGNAPGYPQVMVLDSTHPQAVETVEGQIDLNQTLFLVSSKSGTTMETLSLFRYFWNRMSLIHSKPGRFFAAVSDQGSPLVETAQKRGFRKIFNPPSDVGGRYSAFTDFGLVPAALIGMNISKLLYRGQLGSKNNAVWGNEKNSSALFLGAALGELAPTRDKLTFLSSPTLHPFPQWLEQLIAESTGKKGKGIIPVVDEPLLPVDQYGQDRVFVGLTLEGDPNRELQDFLEKIEKSGHPLIRIHLKDKYELGEEIFRWETAVASAGSILGIHPFNQPDVKLAKDLTRKTMEEKKGRGVSKEEIDISQPQPLKAELKEWISSLSTGDYLSIQAYLSPDPETTQALQRIRGDLLNKTRLATTLGYGPRFLHSTGQLHKGGSNKVQVLQVIDTPSKDFPVPETDYSLRELIQAQSEGDFKALQQRKRRVLRVNLNQQVLEGLQKLRDLIKELNA
ncbi:hypothetical protein KGY73_08340 [bacterium]|nr:hypothetical protein [bacterium]